MVKKKINLLPHVLILAGGFGTRLRPVVSDRPKILAEVSGRPFIEHQLDWLIKQGITRVTFAVHYMADQIIRFIENWNDARLVLDYVVEDEPLGTGGAIANFVQKNKIRGNILVINGDTIFRFSLQPIMLLMETCKTKSLLVASVKKNVSRFGTLIIQGNIVQSFHQATGIKTAGLVNSGVYLMDSSLFSTIKIHPFSLEHEFFPLLAAKGELTAHVVDESEGFFDIGTPESYKKICIDGY